MCQVLLVSQFWATNIHPTDIQDQGAIREAMAGARLQRAFAAFCSTRKQKVPGVDRMVGIYVAPEIVHVKDKQNIEMEKSYICIIKNLHMN